MHDDTTHLAAATADAVSGLGAGFMLAGATYKRGAQLGFQNIDFYFAGRAGVLGDVDADVATSAMVFFAPATVRGAWENSASVMGRTEAAQEFVGCLAGWAAAHLGDDVDWARLADLAGRIVDTAPVAGAPLFAAWRKVATPDDPKVLALHHMNLLRELRMARHGSAVVALGIDIGDSVRHRSPQMLGIFGWEPGEVPDAVAQAWDDAERLTNVATTQDYAVLDGRDGAEFADLAAAALASVH